MKSLESFKSSIFNHDDYSLIGTDPINKGGFGRIYLVENKKTKERLVAKVLTPPEDIGQLSEEFISREIRILIQIQAPTIVSFYGFSFTDFQDHSNVTILMDYKTNGSLADHIKKEERSQSVGGYNNTAKQIILCGIVHGMMTLHLNHVIHRDLKPDNVLLDSNFHPFITDFGLSKFLDPTNSRIQSQSGCGTPFYMAPEVIIDIEYSQEADVYSFGILMYEVLSGHTAYREERKAFKQYQFNNKVLSGMRPEFDSPIKDSLKALIERCWTENPKDRPTFAELFNKLSLSSSKHESDTTKSDKGNLDYCLEGVDVQKVHDYVNLISNKSPGEQKNDEPAQTENEEKNEPRDESKETRNEVDSVRQMRNKIQTEKLKDFTIPSSVTTIEEEGFSYCYELIHITIPSSVTSFGKKAFYMCYKLTNITISSSVTSIGDEAFAYCYELAQIAIPSSLTSIGKEAFKMCYKLTKVVIPSSVTSIGNGAFSYCYELAQIPIPSSLKSIGKEAFAHCYKLPLPQIPSSVTSIGDEAFSGCPKPDSSIENDLKRRFGSNIF